MHNSMMERQSSSCAILANRHNGMNEGLRGLLESSFQTVYVVADATSLREGTQRLTPALIVLDISMEGLDFPLILSEISELSPCSRIIVMSLHDQVTVARLALGAGAHSVVLKRAIATDLLDAIDAVARGEKYVSPSFGLIDA